MTCTQLATSQWHKVDSDADGDAKADSKEVVVACIEDEKESSDSPWFPVAVLVACAAAAIVSSRFLFNAKRRQSF